MNKIKILIAEDEAPARKKLIGFINKTGVETEIIESGDGVSAVEKYFETSPEIIFLDIQMPVMNGFEVLEQINKEPLPVIIFTTAYDQYAIKAFEVSAIDYLLKPFDYGRFEKAFSKALNQLTLEKNSRINIETLLKETKSAKKYTERILVNSGQRYFFINFSDVLYISANEKYVTLHTPEGKHLVRETMQNMEEKLDPGKFTRIHRSYIVNIPEIKEMQPLTHGDYIVVLKNGEKLNLSRRFRGKLFK
ncbi:MAG: LytTR family DNA-binding domain-containing protein [Ignavibacteria bacterium]|jgi:two-component system LytT family response regulator